MNFLSSPKFNVSYILVWVVIYVGISYTIDYQYVLEKSYNLVTNEEFTPNKYVYYYDGGEINKIKMEDINQIIVTDINMIEFYAPVTDEDSSSDKSLGSIMVNFRYREPFDRWVVLYTDNLNLKGVIKNAKKIIE